MQTPPFQLAGVTSAARREAGANLLRPVPDACCRPDPAPVLDGPPHRRGRLSDLDVNMHCSVLGTCLSTTALRSIVQRLAPSDARCASDLDVHHAAVELAGQSGKASKILHKALDDRHAVTLKRFDQVSGEQRLGELWREALESGDVPGAYWAVMTHADTTLPLRRRAFGDVHMLSHLVGAANRADLRRLAALQQQETELKARVDRQQERLQQLGGERDGLQRQRAALQMENDALRTAATSLADSQREIASLRRALQERDRLVAVQTRRREAAEREAAHAVGETATRAEALAIARRMLEALSQEVSALEREVAGGDAGAAAKPSLKSILDGRRVVYVGGRPSTSSAIRALVERSGGELISHDGGIEQRKGQFVSSLPGADVVMFPVDCVDHDSVALLKRQCERHGVPYRALRSASIASFAAAVVEMAPASDQSGSPATRFCLRHG